jgi:hypothetical protein
MAFNISEFSSNISRYGVLHQDKFLVFFVPPLGTNLSTFSDIGDLINTFSTTRIIQLRAQSAKLPGISIRATENVRYGVGVPQKMPYNAQFQDTAISFINDRESNISRYFYSWMTNIVDFNGTSNFRKVPSYTVGYKDDYVTDIYVFVFDEYGNISQVVTMYDAFPNSMNDVSLDWGSSNTLMKLNIGFTYKSWSMDNVNSALGSVADFIGNFFGMQDLGINSLIGGAFSGSNDTGNNPEVGTDQTTLESQQPSP